MMQEASALLLVQPGTRLSVPGKLYEYLAVGRPILALADEGETADLITESKAGIVAKPDDEEAIRKALTSLCRNEAAFAPADSALFDGAQRARELERLLRSLAEAPRGRVAAMPARTGHEV